MVAVPESIAERGVLDFADWNEDQTHEAPNGANFDGSTTAADFSRWPHNL
jgi:hypothetical protein